MEEFLTTYEHCSRAGSTAIAKDRYEDYIRLPGTPGQTGRKDYWRTILKDNTWQPAALYPHDHGTTKGKEYSSLYCT